MHGHHHELRTAESLMEYLQGETEESGESLKNNYLHEKSDHMGRQRQQREWLGHLGDSSPEDEAHRTSTPSPPLRQYHHGQATSNAVGILRRRAAAASMDTDDWQAVFRVLSVESQSRTDGGNNHGEVLGSENGNKYGEEPRQHSNDDTHKEHKNHHQSLRVPWYCPPLQRQYWDDDQVLPHINWGDMFYDLFYVAAGKCKNAMWKMSPSPPYVSALLCSIQFGFNAYYFAPHTRVASWSHVLHWNLWAPVQDLGE
jgi:hypothetical protein